MKKLVLVILALFLFVGGASAANIPRAVDPINAREMWITSVFNDEGSGTVADVGDCVEWKMDSSTGDNKNYVEVCDSADTFLVAGVVWPVDIADQTTGIIVIKGPVETDTVYGTALAGTLVCSSTTAGSVVDCSSGAVDANALGYITAAGSSHSAIVNVFAK